MVYAFRQTDDSVESGLRRIALDQIDAALAEADDADLPMASRIHQVRKRCKKLRALIRLVRPGFEEYAGENAAFRDAAKCLSDVRDAAALVETCDTLHDHYAEHLAPDAFAPIRDALVAAARRRERADDIEERLDRTRKDLRGARDRAAGWRIAGTGPKAAMAGLARTYGRALDAMDAAATEPTGETLHEWRKRVKYHWYHLRLLKSASPVLRAQIEPAQRLSTLLGDHHDLVVLASALDSAEPGSDPAAGELCLGLLRQRRRQLETEAFRVAGQVLPETPKALARRTAAYCRSWQDSPFAGDS